MKQRKGCSDEAPLDRVKDSVIKVGDGRGFIVETNQDRFIITCGHCLPFFPPCHGMSYLNERTYEDLLGRIGDDPPKIWAECLFVDPIADVAVLSGPDSQELSDENDKYEEVTGEMVAIKIRNAKEGQSVWVLSTDEKWRQGKVGFVSDRTLRIDINLKFIKPGMSGSPILTTDACAVGLVSLGANLGTSVAATALPGSLPFWLSKIMKWRG